MSPAIWRKSDEEWQPLLPSGFPSEAALHDLIEEAPNLLPLSGDPALTLLGREYAIGPGYVDLLAVDADGRVTVIEIKLQRNAEARRTVVAQILTYAAYLKGLSVADLEASTRGYLARGTATSIAEAVEQADQSGQFDREAFEDVLADSLTTGAFRLVLVLDEAPLELVQLVGYLESISSGIIVDLITVSAYQVGEEQILVPQRVDPEHLPEPVTPAQRRQTTPAKREIDGSEAFEQAVEHAAPEHQDSLRNLLGWARELEAAQLATLRTVLGKGREIVLVWLRGEKAGLVSIWNDSGPYISLWRSVIVRRAWPHLASIEAAVGKPIGQGTTAARPSAALLEEIAAAYRYAAEHPPTWSGKDFYFAFGEDHRRDWDDAKQYGFVSAGGGAWYSRSLKQLKTGNRVFVYIPQGSGVGGYVGVGEVLGEAALAKDLRVEKDGQVVSYVDVARAPDAGEAGDNPALAEWVVPIRWIVALDRDQAIKDPDFFANQNSAVKLMHPYTQERLREAFNLPD